MVRGLERKTYEQRLHILGLTTLKVRRTRGDLIETFKMLNNKENVDAQQFFQLRNNSHNLRGHSRTIAKSRSRLEIRKGFFSQRAVKPWNVLPEEIVESTTVNTFKNGLDRVVTKWGTES